MIVASFGIVDGYEHPSGRRIESYIYCKTCGYRLELYGDPEIGWLGRCQGHLFLFPDIAPLACPGNRWHIGVGKIAFPVDSHMLSLLAFST